MKNGTWSRSLNLPFKMRVTMSVRTAHVCNYRLRTWSLVVTRTHPSASSRPRRQAIPILTAQQRDLIEGCQKVLDKSQHSTL